jgi:hypothetical protein
MPTILLVNPPNVPNTDPVHLMPRTDLLQDAALLRDLGCTPHHFDMDLARAGLDDLIEWTAVHIPDWIYFLLDDVVPLHSAEAFELLCQMGSAVKQLALDIGKQIRVIMGGMTPSFFVETILDRGAADFVLLGPTGPALRELFSPGHHRRVATLGEGGRHAHPGYYANDRWPSAAELQNLYRCTDYGLADLTAYPGVVMPLLSSRGCDNGPGCSFCPNHPFWGDAKSLSPDAIARDIHYLVDQGYQSFLFIDVNFGFDANRMLQIGNELRQHDVVWGCICRVDMDLSTLPALRDSGLRFVQFGVEAGDDRTLAQLGKRTTVRQVRDAFARCHALEIRTRASFIIDIVDDKEAIENTTSLIVELEPSEVKPHFLGVRPYTRIANPQGQRCIQDTGIYVKTPRFDTVKAEYARKRLDEMLKQQRAAGYQVVDHPNIPGPTWAELLAGWRNHSAAPRFGCLGPSPYGIGWARPARRL